MTTWDLYWITRMDNISAISIFLSVIAGIALLVFGIMYFVAKMDRHEDAKVLKKPFLWSLNLFVFFLLTVISVPTTKELIGILVIPKIVNSQDVQGLGKDLIDTARQWLVEIRPEPKKK